MADERLWQERRYPQPHSTAARRRRLKRRRPGLQRVLRIASWCWVIGIYSAVCVAACFLGATRHPFSLPPVLLTGPTLIYAADGTLLARLNTPKRYPVVLGDVPPATIRAVLAAEDQRFFHHHGLDWQGVLRTGWAALHTGAPAQTGGTLTQQLARLLLLDARPAPRRTLREMVLAIRIERAHTKREILERYLNTAYFGDGAYGVAAAAEHFFGIPVADLSLAESAYLAACLRHPDEGDPRRELIPHRRRQHQVLARMRAADWITAEEYQAALRAPLTFATHPAAPWPCPYAVEAVRRQLLARFDQQLVYQGGLTVETTLLPRVQAAAERALAAAVRDGWAQGIDTGALAAVDPASGAVRALAGGVDFARTRLDRATQPRPPGTAFTPFVYLAALQRGRRLTDAVLDAPVTVAGMTVQSPRYHGTVSLHTALAASLHSVAIRLTEDVSPYAVVAAASAAGITSPLAPNLGIALGQAPVTPLEMARAFATLANDGVSHPPVLITTVRQGARTLFHARSQPRQRVAPEAAYRLTQGLAGVIGCGTGRDACIDRPAAGVTSLGAGGCDAWFVGYTPHLSAAVWLGNDAHRPTRGVCGGGLPARTWAAFMREALAGWPPADFYPPAGVPRLPLPAAPLDAIDTPINVTVTTPRAAPWRPR
jgi:penicillin-binding protein 1A